MSITNTGPKSYQTSNNNVIWTSQLNASARFKFRYELDGNIADASGAFIVARDFYTTIAVLIVGAGSTAGTVRLRFYVLNAAGSSFNISIDMAIGVTHDICVTHDGLAGAQYAWVDGSGTRISSFTGLTQGGVSRRWNVSGISDTTPRMGTSWTLEDVCVWNGYTLTYADIIALRSGDDPTTIGASATQRFRWTLSGTPGVTPAIGDSGLLEYYGQTAYNLIAIGGAGSSVYSNSLVWEPSAQIVSAYVGTSGGTIILRPANIATGNIVNPTQLLDTPTISVNDVSLGALQNPTMSDSQTFILFTIPGDLRVSSSDVVTLDAPTGFLNTAAGLCQGLARTLAINNTGQSCFGTPVIEKTLQLGINFDYFPTGNNALGWIPKNLAKVISSGTGVATRDAFGKPITLTGTSAEFLLYQNQAISVTNKIDSTGYPGPVGLFAQGWDDINPAVPTTWVMAANDSTTTVVTERLDLRNTGSNGIGQVRVYNVQKKDGSVVATTDVKVVLSNSARTPQYANHMIFAPGDFSYADNTPTVLSTDDPYAPSGTLLSRFNNPGSIRMWVPLLGSINCFMSEAEHSRDLEDFTWGWRGSKVSRQFGYTSAAPYSRADTPYFYTPVMGSRYSATLTTGIDSSQTTIDIVDADTAPVITGQRLYIGSEVLRVDDVSGTTVTVTRGMQGTTPASHSAGAIEVGYRNAMVELGTAPINSAVWVKFTTSTPHRIMSGTSVTFSGTGWPTLTCTDGRTSLPTSYAGCAMVTGANSFVLRLGPYQAPGVTLTGTTVLNPANQTTTILIGNTPQLPYPMASKLANSFDCHNLFISVPHMATTDLLLKLARQVRDEIDPGRTIWIEVSNETWNTGAGYVNQFMFFSHLSAALYPGQTLLSSYVKRTDEVLALFRSVFDEDGRNRSGEIKCFLNVQFDTLNGNALLTWAAAQLPQIKVDGLAASPYINVTNTHQFPTAIASAFNALDPDQAIDLWIHALAYRINDGVPYQAQQWRNAVSAYNTAVNHDCKFMSYEGGLELPYSSSMTYFKERSRDFFYHPNFYVVEQDFFALIQQSGFEMFNVYGSSADWQGTNGYVWGLYHSTQQQYGRGDGSDGKANNLLCLATPGLTNSKSATTNQDATNVTVRGKAWLDWNTSSNPPTPTIKPRFTPRSVVRVMVR